MEGPLTAVTHIEFKDRIGNKELLPARVGQRISGALKAHGIPPSSVVVLCKGDPISSSARIEAGSEYIAALIEGYDIGRIRAVHAELEREPVPGAAYTYRHLSFDRAGALEPEVVDMDLPTLAAHVEQTVADTCNEFSLIDSSGGVLIGLSGGVDSSSLAIALTRNRSSLPPHRLVAVTFEDFDSRSSPTWQHASELADRLGIEHHMADADMAREIFHLNRPLREILPLLMETDDAHHVMYIDHHTTRRVLEVFAERQEVSRIALGLHTTDLVAGLLNSWFTGYEVAQLPLRQIGSITYIYPLAFITKQQLHLYHLHQVSSLARHASPNAWERAPLDRNFYYYLADMLQEHWPGLHTQLFSAHRWRGHRSSAGPIEYVTCPNCKSSLLHQPMTPISSPLCDACRVFEKYGYLAGGADS